MSTMLPIAGPAGMSGGRVRRRMIMAFGCLLVGLLFALGLTSVPAQALNAVVGEERGLPDSRVYEMVTPPNDGDAEAFVPNAALASGNEEGGFATNLPFQASLDGNALGYVGRPSSAEGGGNGIYGAGAGNEFVATRSADGVWTRVNVQPRGVAISAFQAFSPDLSIGILDARRSLLPGLPERIDALYTRDGASGAYHAVFTPPANGRQLETAGVPTIGNYFSVVYAGASASFAQILFEANGALTADAIDGGERENNLYDSLNGQLQLVNVLPDGSTEPNATFGSPAQEEHQNDVPDFDHVISADGTRIFWSSLTEEGEPKALYVREDGTRTVQLDAVQGGSGPGGGGRYVTASEDGSRVFFTDADSAGLTADTHAGSGVNLYEFDLDTGSLMDLTPTADARVSGVAGVSEDGAYVYFAAGGALAAGAASQACERIGAEDAPSCNLYVRHAGVTSFVAALASRDGNGVTPATSAGDGTSGDWQSGLGNRTAEVTPDGHHLVFTSIRSLAGYQSNGSEEVYVYDAGTAQIECASCSRSGELPPPGNFAAFLPISHSFTRTQRWIANDGSRVFFDSTVPLVAQDTNGVQDVYEWEREGAGDCRRSGGCVYLLSGGSADTASWLLDISASGNDVFIATRARLLPEDQNEAFDVYDVRVGGVSRLSAPVCSGSGCQGVPPAPAFFATPPSVTFNGVGDFAPPAAKPRARAKPLTRAQRLAKALKVCRSGRKAKRAACEVRVRKRYGPGSVGRKKSVKKSAKRFQGRGK